MAFPGRPKNKPPCYMTVATFNMTAPPGFRGLHPDLRVKMYRRHLPHWRQEGATYFVTFRLSDALPQSKLEALRRWRAQWERQNPAPRSEEQWKVLAREITRRTEAWMDEGYGECVFRQPAFARLMAEALVFFQDQRYRTTCYTIMPNHCHVVVKPVGAFELEEIVASWKGYVARKVNRRFDRKGVLWQQESYDSLVRDEEHLYRVVQYIGNNGARAGIRREQWHRWIHPDWEAAGWSFHDQG